MVLMVNGNTPLSKPLSSKGSS